MPENKAPKHDPKWAKAKAACRLNMEDIRMAKALGFSPKALIKNNPSPSELWKQPVKYWIRELYDKRLGNKNARTSAPQEPRSDAIICQNVAFDEDVPF